MGSLPKTAGDATCLMLTSVPGLVQFADPVDSNDKHMPFFGREAEVAGKLLAMNIRRLPGVGAQRSSAQGPATGFTPATAPARWRRLDQITSRTDADDLLRWMTDHGRFHIDRWLRAEQLEADVLDLLGELGELTPVVRTAVLAVGRVNEGAYPRELEREFTAEQIARLYRMNPGWAEVERRAYGALPVD